MPEFNASELLLLVVLAVIIFGPDKLPELARKTARVVNYLRGIANDARSQIAEVVPELADLQLTDLTPRGLSTKLLGAETTADLAQAGQSVAGDARDLTAQMRQAGREVQREVKDVPNLAAAGSSLAASAAAAAPAPAVRLLAFDPEST